MADTFDASNIEESLTKKIGGLPGFAWVGIGVAAVFLYKKYKGGSSTSTTAAAPLADATTTPSDASSTPIQTLPLGSNALWAQTAANQLLATSSYSPSDIQTALANYQSGNGLTSTQQTIIDSVLHSFGTPPEGVIPVYQADTSSTNTSYPQSISDWQNALASIGINSTPEQIQTTLNNDPGLGKQFVYPANTPTPAAPAAPPSAGGSPTPSIAANPQSVLPVVGAQPRTANPLGGAYDSSNYASSATVSAPVAKGGGEFSARAE